MATSEAPVRPRVPREGPSATFPCCFPRCCRRSRRRTASAYIDGTFGAGGYTEAILDRRARLRACSASTAIPPPSPPASAWPRSIRGRLDAGRRPLRRPRPHRARRRLRARPTASCSTSASPPCSSTIPRAASPSRATGRSTCACRADGPTAADVVNGAEEAHLADILFHLGEERSAARHRPRHRRAARSSSPSRARRELAELVARVLGARRSPAGMRPRARSRRCASTSTTSSASWRAASRRPSACWHRAGASSSSPSTRWRTGWSSGSSRTARRRRRTGSRHLPPQTGARPRSEFPVP